MNVFARIMLASSAAAALASCAGQAAMNAVPGGERGFAHRTAGSLGPVLSTSDGGQIFGFDVDQNGKEGVLASASYTDISVQTFDETTGKISKTFGVKTGKAVQKGDDYVADGIFAGDVALVDFQRAGKPGSTPAKDEYRVMNPVTAEKFTGKWSASIKLFNVLQNAENQSTSTSVVFGYQRIGSDTPKLVVSDIAKNQVSNVIQLDNQFSLADGPQLAQDTINNLAVMATSPSAGGAGGPPPVIATVNLASGKVTEFNGVNCPGSVGCGFANGIGYDSATGVACTTTELDGGIEFYNVSKQTGFHELLPNGGGQTFAGTYVASDAANKLFLIAQPFSSTSQSGSSVQVYDENGSLVESINGFNFTDAGGLVIPIKIAINPSRRIGWVNGPSVNQLQEFSY
ncbi:MAG TPA: hypothetical protein VEW74_07825 [Candidatus Nitrosotalea sp.]|nr:hypothetical protein [Candidatus Nitrosotalea sp.]